jgi:hypothetical protein
VSARKTFVIWISREAVGGAGRPVLEGRIEEVDTGREQNFHSAEQLISFLEDRLPCGETRAQAS